MKSFFGDGSAARVVNVSHTIWRVSADKAAMQKGTDGKIELMFGGRESARMLTVSLENYVAVADGDRREDERVIVRCRLVGSGRVPNPVPRILLDVDVRLSHVAVLAQEVLRQCDGELLRRTNAVLLRQQVDGVLLRVRRYDVRVVACSSK